MEDLFAVARAKLAEQVGIEAEKITMETSFEEIQADSIDIVEMLMSLEDHYDVEFPEEDLENYPTVGSLLVALYTYLQQAKNEQ